MLCIALPPSDHQLLSSRVKMLTFMLSTSPPITLLLPLLLLLPHSQDLSLAQMKQLRAARFNTPVGPLNSSSSFGPLDALILHSPLFHSCLQLKSIPCNPRTALPLSFSLSLFTIIISPRNNALCKMTHVIYH